MKCILYGKTVHVESCELFAFHFLYGSLPIQGVLNLEPHLINGMIWPFKKNFEILQ